MDCNEEISYACSYNSVSYLKKWLLISLIRNIHSTWISCHVSDYKPIYVVVNCGIFLILIIAKIPEMHKVRLFGINSTLGIDTKVEYKRKKQR